MTRTNIRTKAFIVAVTIASAIIAVTTSPVFADAVGVGATTGG